MKKNIHPELRSIDIQCRCGKQFNVLSTMGQQALNTERCGFCLATSANTYSASSKQSAREKLFENFNISDMS